MRNTEMAVRRLVEAGNGSTRKLSDDLKAWIMPYEDGMVDVYVGSKSKGRIVFEECLETFEVEGWLASRKFQHEAEMAIVIKCGTCHIKTIGNKLVVLLLSDSDAPIDHATIAPADLYEWLRVRQDW